MATKSNSSTVRLSKNVVRYVTNNGKMLDFPLLMENFPRISAVHTGQDEKFLSVNKGKLQKLQHIFA